MHGKDATGGVGGEGDREEEEDDLDVLERALKATLSAEVEALSRRYSDAPG